MKRKGPKATAFLADQTRSRRTRAPKPVEAYAAPIRDWLLEAARRGEVELTVPEGGPKPGTLVLEMRRFCRAVFDTHHPLAAEIGSVMILQPKGRTIRIVRRDNALGEIVAKSIDHKVVIPMGAVGKPDPMDAILELQNQQDMYKEILKPKPVVRLQEAQEPVSGLLGPISAAFDTGGPEAEDAASDPLSPSDEGL